MFLTLKDTPESTFSLIVKSWNTKKAWSSDNPLQHHALIAPPVFVHPGGLRINLARKSLLQRKMPCKPAQVKGKHDIDRAKRQRNWLDNQTHPKTDLIGCFL